VFHHSRLRYTVFERLFGQEERAGQDGQSLEAMVGLWPARRGI
jgi:hypothetical protein